jgi:hypothetical protein
MLLAFVSQAIAIEVPTPAPSSVQASDEPTSGVTTSEPTLSSEAPTVAPTRAPTRAPTPNPTSSPSEAPSEQPEPIIHTAVFTHGNSGKITLYDNRYPGISDPNAVTMRMSFLREVSGKTGKVVGKAGKIKHTIESFASQKFAFTSLFDTDLYGLDAKSFSFTSAVSNVGSVQIDAYIMMEGGEVVSNTGELMKVLPGDFKFSVQLLDWKWCSPCQDGTGDFIDVGIEIQGRNKKIKNGDLGAGIPLLLAKNINIDGRIVKMPTGYPKVETVGGKQTLVFRFPKSGGAAVYDYDPIIGMARSVAYQK